MTTTRRTLAGCALVAAAAFALGAPAIAHAGGTKDPAYNNPPATMAPNQDGSEQDRPGSTLPGLDDDAPTVPDGALGDGGQNSESGAASCIKNIKLDIPSSPGGPAGFLPNGNEDMGVEYTVRIHNAGSSTCTIKTDSISLKVTGAGSKTCTPIVQNLTLAPKREEVISSKNGSWGHCVTDAVKRPGSYQIQAFVKQDGVVVKSNKQAFVAAVPGRR
ncbi:hypothetical protein SAMN04488550_4400 [Gordonia malaquae]|uniref:DUF4232 domain-containing protein n=1 Tax=Gordonia malaquae NBRC 108250 TaxID=1223542 RepID=M3UII1_GORML|nr:hypothetical protein [Gordonia malaquae]GAC79240.1 hypothetical protein GM1_008_00020 [Gordonia malaquae NBRC 108250]SEE37088.1 hypothetical protein SAMN04488550_4400 [Gordonia malaquae]